MEGSLGGGGVEAGFLQESSFFLFSNTQKSKNCKTTKYCRRETKFHASVSWVLHNASVEHHKNQLGWKEKEVSFSRSLTPPFSPLRLPSPFSSPNSTHYISPQFPFRHHPTETPHPVAAPNTTSPHPKALTLGEKVIDWWSCHVR